MAEKGRSQVKAYLQIILVTLKCMQSVCSVGVPSLKHDHVMLWAVCCLGFFGCTAPLSGKDFDAGVHL